MKKCRKFHLKRFPDIWRFLKKQGREVCFIIVSISEKNQFLLVSMNFTFVCFTFVVVCFMSGLIGVTGIFQLKLR